MSFTITGTASALITLSSADFNPVTIDSQALLQAGLYGEEGVAWTITNLGIINNTSTAAAVTLHDGGRITNASSGTISAGNGIIISNAAGYALNAGTIAGTAGTGISLSAGGTVTNDVSASVTGQVRGVAISGDAGTVSNAGVILAIRAVYLADGGRVTNQAGGTLSGFIGAEFGVAAAGTVTNAGYIYGANIGVNLDAGGSITNQASGTIASAGKGIYASGGAVTVTNSGEISGTIAAVQFAAGYADRLVISPSASFVGMVDGGNAIGSAIVSTLELASGTSAGTLSALGSLITRFGNITVDSGAAWALSGATIGSGYTIKDAGTLTNTSTLNVAVTLDSGAALTNTADGKISGSAAAMVYSAGTATVVNAGLISDSDSAGAALQLKAGGQVSNQSGGTLTAALYGAYLGTGGAATLSNSGVITAAKGVRLSGGGLVTNQSGGSISGTDYGIWLTSHAGTIVNAGNVSGTKGVYLKLDDDGATVTNQSSGTITGTDDGIALGPPKQGGLETVVNAGTILSTGSTGIGLYSPISVIVTNQSSGVISGTEFGIRIKVDAEPLTIINNGTIIGGSIGLSLSFGGYNSQVVENAGVIEGTDYALQFAPEQKNTLVVDPGASFIGKVDGRNTIGGNYTTKLELATGATAGTLSGLGSQFVNFARLIIDSNANWTLTSAALPSGYLIADNGTLTNSGVLDSPVTLSGTGAVLANAAGATITSSDNAAVYGEYAGVTVTNAGRIVSSNKAVYLYDDGHVTNLTGGTLSGYDGVRFGTTASGTVINAGVIYGSNNGIDVRDGGVITNQAGGTITSASRAVYVRGDGAATVTNAGVITGVVAAVGFTAGYADRLIVVPGALFSGSVDGGNTIGSAIASTLELASGSAAGTLSRFGSQFTRFANITIDSGAAWTLASATIGDGYTITDSGTLTNTGTLGVSVSLTHSGAVLSNASSGKITNSSTAAIHGIGTVINDGEIKSIGSSSGSGINLTSGGMVSNQSAGYIYGYTAITIAGAAGSVDNDGTILSGLIGIKLANGGTVSNAAGGLITAALSPIAVYGSTGTVVNAGTIRGFGSALGGTLVNLLVGGAFTNQTGGIISGGAVGVGIRGGTVVNAGSITASSRAIYLYDGGHITNQSGGVLQGTTLGVKGRLSIGGITLVNDGLISGGSLGAQFDVTGGAVVLVSNDGTIAGGVSFASSLGSTATLINAGAITGDVVMAKQGTGRLIYDPGASFTGTVDGGHTIGDSVVSTLELASGASAGTLSDLGSSFTGFGKITIDTGAAWTLNSPSLASGYTIIDSGTLTNTGTLNSPVTLSADDATLINASSGSITAAGTAAVYSTPMPVTVTNAGHIVGSNKAVYLSGFGSHVSNQTGGTISGMVGVAFGTAAFSTLRNAGVIYGSTDGVYLGDGGSVINQAGGTITSTGRGVYVGGSIEGTVTNGGVIIGTAAAVTFKPGYNDRLIIDPGASFVGSVDGGNAAGSSFASTLELASGTSTGTLSGLGSQVIHFAQITVDTNATWALASSTIGSLYTLSNSGTVVSAVKLSGTDVQLTNAFGAVITAIGTAAVYGSAGPVTITNSGRIIGSDKAVYLYGSGLVTNLGPGTISGSVGVRFGTTAAGTLVNAGTIYGSNDGIYLRDGGVITNQGGATITSAGRGIYVDGYGAATVTNNGLIAGTVAAVKFGAGFADRLIVNPGGAFDGTVDGGNTAGSTIGSTLELASGSTAGILTGFGTQIIDFGQITVDSNAAWTMFGNNTLVSGISVTNLGTLLLTSATLTDADTIANNGGIVLDPSTMTVGGLVGTGAVTIDAGSTLFTTGTVGSGETIDFAASSGSFYLTPGSGNFAGQIDGFAAGDTIGLTGISDATSAMIVGSNTLAITTSGEGTIALQMDPSQDFTGVTFNVGERDGNAVITGNSLCFVAGTRIRTESGEVRVERLAVGDHVMTLAGVARPIRWIGSGRVTATRGRRDAATPVIVRKGALDKNMPVRDLRLTKGHALCLDGLLIPVEELINHRSILWDDRAQDVRLFHIELETHDVLWADGAPAETYRDDGNRWLFQNANSGWDLPPQLPCMPIMACGPQVDAIWRRLLLRAGPRPAMLLTGDPDLHVVVDGQRVDAAVRQDGRYVFELPTCAGTVRLSSHACVPQELGIGRDPRVLGIAVRRIEVTQKGHSRVMTASAAELVEGFHAYEPDHDIRWSKGDAALPPELFASMNSPGTLIVALGAATQYLDHGQVLRPT